MVDFNGQIFDGPLAQVALDSAPALRFDGALLRGSIGVTIPSNPAPVVTFLAPVPGSTISRTRSISFEVEDSDVALLIVAVRFGAIAVEEVAYWGGRFADQYSQSQVATLGDVSTFLLIRTNGWPSDPTIEVAVSDGLGQVA